jgi:amino acid permease
VNAKRVEIMQAYRQQKTSRSGASKHSASGVLRRPSMRWVAAGAVAVIAGLASYYLISGGTSGGGMAGAAGANAILAPLGVVVFVLFVAWLFLMREKK